MSNARIPDLILEKYGASHPEKLLEVQNKIAEGMKVTEALTALGDASKTVDASRQGRGKDPEQWQRLTGRASPLSTSIRSSQWPAFP